MKDSVMKDDGFVVAIIGIGLIGGSMAIALKENGFARKVIGVDANLQHCSEALQLKLVDKILDLQSAMKEADIVILATPVNIADMLISQILTLAKEHVVVDVGSTKNSICNISDQHIKRKRFVATHPMWGTEFSGPSAAIKGAFKHKAVVICDKDKSDIDAIRITEILYKSMDMHILYMDSISHDLHAAYISHISHISSFALANTVLEKEKEENAIFEMASGGFESTVRLAKSSASMWLPIFKQNRENILDVLNEHIAQLKKFKSCLEKENYDYLLDLITNANEIRKVLEPVNKEQTLIEVQ